MNLSRVLKWAKDQSNFTSMETINDECCSCDINDGDIPPFYFEKRQRSMSSLEIKKKSSQNISTSTLANKILQRPPKLVHGYKTFKIMLLGAPNVGKTCLVKRFVHDKFNDDHLPTIADIYETGLFLNFDNQLKQFDIEINDFSGDFKHDFPEIYREKILLSDGFIIVYSKDEPNSLANVVEIVADINKLKEAPVTMVLENKSDCENNNNDKIKTEFQIINSRHMKVSAKSNTGVHEAITTLIYDLEERIDIDKPNIIDLICGYLEKLF